MDKKSLFKTLSFTGSVEVIGLGDRIAGNHSVVLLKKPEKMLVMLKVRESACNSLFYAGEALACACTVRIGDIKGFAACLGDDTDKVYAMAVIDAALNAGLPERDIILESLRAWEEDILRKQSVEAELTMSTKVNFSVMEE